MPSTTLCPPDRAPMANSNAAFSLPSPALTYTLSSPRVHDLILNLTFARPPQPPSSVALSAPPYSPTLLHPLQVAQRQFEVRSAPSPCRYVRYLMGAA